MGRKKMKGGDVEINYNKGGPGGSLSNLPLDIVGTVIYAINSIVASVKVVDTIGNLKSDMGVAFNEQAAPNPDDIDIRD